MGTSTAGGSSWFSRPRHGTDHSPGPPRGGRSRHRTGECRPRRWWVFCNPNDVAEVVMRKLMLAVGFLLLSVGLIRAELPAGVSWTVTIPPEAYWEEGENGNWVMYVYAKVEMAFPPSTTAKRYYVSRFGPLDKSVTPPVPGNSWETKEDWVPEDGGTISRVFHVPVPVRAYFDGGMWVYIDFGLYEYTAGTPPMLVQSWLDPLEPYWVDFPDPWW